MITNSTIRQPASQRWKLCKDELQSSGLRIATDDDDADDLLMTDEMNIEICWGII
jgi:hypothetical protein